MKVLTSPEQTTDPGQLIEMPEFLKQTHRVPWATPYCRRYHFGMILNQEFVHKYYTINIYYCDCKEEAVVYPYYDKPAIALQVFMSGSVTSIHEEGQELELQAESFSLVYIPSGTHKVKLNAGVIEACMVVFEKDYLAELTEGWPMQQQLMDLINNSSKTGMPFPSALLSYEAKAEIGKMHQSQKTDYLLVLELKSCITKLLGTYLTSIADRPFLETLPNVPYKDTLIRIWETIKANPNIHDHTLPKLSKLYNLHEKTLGRKFVTMFNISISVHVREQCMQKAYMLITTTNMTMEDIGFELGYSELSNFKRAFKSKFKLAPQALRVMNKRPIKMSINDLKNVLE